jgi:hypothetical protein
MANSPLSVSRLFRQCEIFSISQPYRAPWAVARIIIPWPQSASELYRPSDSRLSAKLVPTFVDSGVSRGQRDEYLWP